MKILVRRTGGFAGISETLYDVDTSTLDASAAAELEPKVRQLESEASSEGAGGRIKQSFALRSAMIGSEVPPNRRRISPQ